MSTEKGSGFRLENVESINLAWQGSQRQPREFFAMFDSLDEQMKKDMNKETSPRQRMLMWVVIVLASILIFGGLYFGVRLIS
jgi:hypothetical protein